MGSRNNWEEVVENTNRMTGSNLDAPNKIGQIPDRSFAKQQVIGDNRSSQANPAPQQTQSDLFL